MNKYSNHDYANPQLLDCGVDKSVMSKQNFANMIIQHKLEGTCNVNSTRSSYSKMSLELPSATSTKFLNQQVIIVAHVDVNMNLSGK